MSDRQVTLQSSDGKEFQVKRAVAEMSGTLKNMLEGAIHLF